MNVLLNIFLSLLYASKTTQLESPIKYVADDAFLGTWKTNPHNYEVYYEATDTSYNTTGYQIFTVTRCDAHQRETLLKNEHISKYVSSNDKDYCYSLPFTTYLQETDNELVESHFSDVVKESFLFINSKKTHLTVLSIEKIKSSNPFFDQSFDIEQYSIFNEDDGILLVKNIGIYKYFHTEEILVESGMYVNGKYIPSSKEITGTPPILKVSFNQDKTHITLSTDKAYLGEEDNPFVIYRVDLEN